ncbi:MAG: hypothetical protein FWF21_13585 [Micrococcales bacterium]|nr:hypothetical protein [Micrococcales bacterium]
MAAKPATMHRLAALCTGASGYLSVLDVASVACEENQWTGSGAAMT